MIGKQASFAMFTLLWSSATLFGQMMNALSAQERVQGWQLLFDGKTLARLPEHQNSLTALSFLSARNLGAGFGDEALTTRSSGRMQRPLVRPLRPDGDLYHAEEVAVWVFL